MEKIVELAYHLPMCIGACLLVHFLEVNWKGFHSFTHLHWLRRGDTSSCNCALDDHH